ncbi:MAG: ParA family protein [Elusimicrobia bacterium]|nr:ParA family protein [Elusimicrobiota bacterium]
MAEIIAIANQKGGVGKTTTAINLAAGLACLGQDTLLVDLDPQANATSGLGFDKNQVEQGAFENIVDLLPAEKTIKASPVELLDVLCSSPDMVSAEIQLASAISRENRLRNCLKPVRDSYSFIIIDCPPSLGLLTLNALAASDKVMVPIQAEYYALEGLAAFLETVRVAQERLNTELGIEGAVLTMYDPRYTLAQQVRGELEKYFQGALFRTSIPRSVRLAEAPSFGKTIYQYDPKSKGSETYLALAGELLSRRGWRGMRLN